MLLKVLLQMHSPPPLSVRMSAQTRGFWWEAAFEIRFLNSEPGFSLAALVVWVRTRLWQSLVVRNHHSRPTAEWERKEDRAKLRGSQTGESDRTGGTAHRNLARIRFPSEGRGGCDFPLCGSAPQPDCGSFPLYSHCWFPPTGQTPAAQKHTDLNKLLSISLWALCVYLYDCLFVSKLILWSCCCVGQAPHPSAPAHTSPCCTRYPPSGRSQNLWVLAPEPRCRTWTSPNTHRTQTWALHRKQHTCMETAVCTGEVQVFKPLFHSCKDPK